MTDLILSVNLARSDDVYARLLAAHDGLDEAESQALNARLILILMNHIGDADVLMQAIDAAGPDPVDAELA
ncbi:DUF2783 domain-containing protein [Jannaschia donghaensis]|uniref:DUF2783 domain-containing protein n=1 Tax=Jannaschia donghaensis TaxID=420998 RepID=A0A0M6YPJ2_9RHOB|nr:DUF2783 domain-containing protein [Jannaschia donghaensis]CTQ51453.1 hypothetical protein JDO7802_03493 [Jannaschia donghaensis]